MSYVRREGGQKLTHHPYPTRKLPPGISAKKKTSEPSLPLSPAKNIQRRKEEKLCELSDGCRFFGLSPFGGEREREVSITKNYNCGCGGKVKQKQANPGTTHKVAMSAHT